MAEPPRQLPPSVYWRRRAVAIAATVVVVVLLIWGLGALLTGSNERDGSSTNPGNANWQHPAAPKGPPSSMPTPSDSASSSPSAGPSSSVPPPSGVHPSASAGRTSVPPSSEPSPSESTGPQPCSPSLLHVTASTDRHSYSVGERPKFTMRVINVAKQPCFQDIGHAQRKLIVGAKDGERLWNSADCSFGGAKHERRTLKPDKPVSFDVRWAGRSSAPGCPEDRSTVRSGNYELTAKLGDVPSILARFTIR